MTSWQHGNLLKGEVHLGEEYESWWQSSADWILEGLWDRIIITITIIICHPCIITLRGFHDLVRQKPSSMFMCWYGALLLSHYLVHLSEFGREHNRLFGFGCDASGWCCDTFMADLSGSIQVYWCCILALMSIILRLCMNLDILIGFSVSEVAVTSALFLSGCDTIKDWEL